MRDLSKLTADKIQQMAHKTSPGISTVPSMQSEASRHLHIVAAYEQAEIELRERLEQCAAALRLCIEALEEEDGELNDKALAAAHAALEGE